METAGSPLDATVDRLLDWLSEMGPRWGLPAEACRVHGYLYFTARPASIDALSERLGMTGAVARDALGWLQEFGLVQVSTSGLWQTGSDPWALVVTALEHRRSQELGPALDLLRASGRDASGDPLLFRQIGRLLGLVEDIAAIDGQARRFSPQMLRGLVGAGGRMARMIGAVTGKRG